MLQNNLGRRFAAALIPRLFGKNPRSHHKDAKVFCKLQNNLSILKNLKTNFSQQFLSYIKNHPMLFGPAK